MDIPSPHPEPAPEPRRAIDWSVVLAGTPREVLARVIDGDPLSLVERCRERLERQVLLLDLKRLHLRATAHVARHAGEYRGAPVLDVWLAGHVGRAVKELVAEDAAVLRSDAPTPAARDPRILALAELLGIDPALVLRGCAAFNQAPYEVRRAFQGVVLDGVSLDAWARGEGIAVSQARALVRRALWLLGLRGDLDLDGFLAGGGDEA